MTPGDVQLLDLGRRDRPDGPADPPPGLPDARTLLRVAAAVAAALAVLAGAAPDSRPPRSSDLEVALAAGAGTAEHRLDAAPVGIALRNRGPRPLLVEVSGLDTAEVEGSPPPVRLEPEGSGRVVVLAVPDCAAGPLGEVRVRARSATGTADLALLPSSTGDPFGALCPPEQRGVHASVTGTAPGTTRSVVTRVVNDGTEPVVLVALPLVPALVADGSTVYLDPGIEVEPGTDRDGPPPVVYVSPVLGSPLLPLGLSPGDAVVLTLSVAPGQCDSAVGGRLEARGENGFQAVEGSEAVVAELLAAAC